jgi:hypothetical protein
MPSDSDKQQRLRDEGVILEGAELPQEYAAVIEGLTPSEVEVIVAVKKRFDEAGRVSGHEAGEYIIPP